MMMMAAPDNATSAEAAEEKTEFDLVLESFPADKKIAVLKIVRELTGLGLKEAKELVESAPKTIKEAIAKEAAEDAKKQKKRERRRDKSRNAKRRTGKAKEE